MKAQESCLSKINPFIELRSEALRMLPAEIGTEAVTSSERRVFDALASCPIRGVALHSLNLPDHQYKMTSEIDFLLLLEDIVLVVEVKGGRVSCTDGVWTYSDRAGNHRTSREGPFKQVQSAMYALRDRLEGRLGTAVDDVAFGWMVVTPDVDIPSSFEWDDATYCGRGPFSRGFDKAVNRTRKYWKAKQPGRKKIDKPLEARILSDLRPTFDHSPLLEARASLLDAAILRLTDEQYARLDLISDEPRVICSGGAGTGKTFLATEAARRQALTGARVLFVCRSEVLAKFVASTLTDTSVRVINASELQHVVNCYDVLIIDEGQDLMNFEHLDRLERVINGGWSEGRWTVFSDPNSQAHLYGDFDTQALQYLDSFNPVKASLKFNCRNTREIAFQTRAFTGADIGVAAAGAGPEVEFVVVDDEQSEQAALERHLRALSEEEVAPEHVTIVSVRGSWDESAAKGIRAVRKGRVARVTPALASSWPPRGITWSSVVDFKGLENRFVCVIDIDAVRTREDLDRLYVALSRPRAGLWIAASNDVSVQLKELSKGHIEGALEAYRKAGK